jgi:hypothetical protein
LINPNVATEDKKILRSRGTPDLVFVGGTAMVLRGVTPLLALVLCSFFCLSSSAPITCKDGQGNPVGWWFVRKVPNSWAYWCIEYKITNNNNYYFLLSDFH